MFMTTRKHARLIAK